jgi:hypothetical protein
VNGRKECAQGERRENERRPGLTNEDQISFSLPTEDGAVVQSRIDHHTSKHDDAGREPPFQ